MFLLNRDRFTRLLSTFLLLSSCLWLLACSQSTPTNPAEETQKTSTSLPVDDQRFVLKSSGGEEFSGRPALYLSFTQPLVQEQDFNQLIQITDQSGATPEGSWILDAEDPSILRFPYLKGNHTYTVNLSENILTVSGKAFESQGAYKINSGKLTPVIGFASRGSVLPVRGTQGLPVVGVNVAEVDVEFFRVNEKMLSHFLNEFGTPSRRHNWDLESISKMSSSVYSNRFALTIEKNQRQVSFIPVQSIEELKQAGVYFAVMRRAGSFGDGYETTHFYVTDLGLHARKEKDSLFVHVASLASGQPRKGVEIFLQNQKGEVLASSISDTTGGTTLNFLPKQHDILIARQSSEIALVSFNQPALDLSEFEVDGRKQTPQEVYAWSGRDLFRPGEPLQVSALLRDHDGRLLAHKHTLFATLRQPDGKAISTLPLEPQDLGYYSYQRTLAEDVPTGRWSLEYRLDPSAPKAIGRFSFRIEEFLPERLKLTLDSPRASIKPNDVLPIEVDGAFLYGAPAAGNRFVAELMYRHAVNLVPSLKGYYFGDPTIALPSEPQPALDVALKDDGKFQANLTLFDGDKSADATSISKVPIDIIVNGSLFESGGRAIRRALIRTQWPADAVVGIRPLFDPKDGPNANSQASFEIVKTKADGSLVAANDLQVKLVRELRNYHWNWVDGSGWNTDYTRHFQTISEATINFDGQSAALFNAQVEWGEYRLEITDPTTQLITRYPFTAGWSWDNDNQGLDARPDKVKIAFDQSGYRLGDTATLSITAPYDGPALILVESDRIVYRKNIDVRGTTQVKVPITNDLLGHNLYVTALVFRPANQEKLSGPNRAVGVAHLPMARDNRQASLTLSTPEVTRPGESLSISVSSPELAGEEAYVVVQATDLGIINLTGFPVPDALSYFLSRRGLSIEAFDLYGRIIGPMEGERARLRYGGDAALSALPQARRPTAKVQTVAMHHAPVRFDNQGRATLNFIAPDFNGTLRIAALAYSADRYAQSSDESIVRAPLVMEVSTPRVMAPGDQSQLTVDLHNLSGAQATYRVSASAEAPLTIESQVHTLTLADNARSTVHFQLRAADGSTSAKFHVRAESDAVQMQRNFEMVVRPAWPAVRRSQASEITQAQTLNFDSSLFEGLHTQSGIAQISISSAPPLPFAEAISGLISYPYGCLEQTTSRLWPLVNMDEATSIKFGLEPLEESKRKAMIDSGFGRVSAMQTQRGDFTFWPGEGSSDPQMTAYVADLLVTARENGISIPTTVLDKAKQKLKEGLLTGGENFYNYENSDHLRFSNNAYSAYVLARLNDAPLGTLRSLWDNQHSHSRTALPLVYLGLALKLAGDEPRSNAAIEAALKKSSSRPLYLGDYGSDLRDEALLLALLYENNLDNATTGERLMALARNIRLPKHSRQWFSTQERLAIFRLGKAVLRKQPIGLQGQFFINDTPHALSDRALVSRQVDAKALNQGVSLTLEGDGPFWLSTDIVGYPKTAPTPNENGITIERAWYTTDGKRFTGNQLTEGDTLIAVITVETKEDLPDALVVDLLPGGLEIENLELSGNDTFSELLIEGSRLDENDWMREVRTEEFRDDRYVAAVKLLAHQPVRLYYLARAVSPGSYTVPPVNVEDMYRPQLSNVGTSTIPRITVVSPK